MSFDFEYPKTITEEENQKIAERLADAVSRVCDNMQANHTAERLEKAVSGENARGGVVLLDDDELKYTAHPGEVVLPMDELAEQIRRSYETGDRSEDEEDDRVIDIDEEDPINSPSHYQLEGLDVEVIDVIVAVLTPEELAGYCRGNVIKYMLRASQKGGREDYLKAEKYLGWLIDLT